LNWYDWRPFKKRLSPVDGRYRAIQRTSAFIASDLLATDPAFCWPTHGAASGAAMYLHWFPISHTDNRQ
jgi:hypothetical protein